MTLAEGLQRFYDKHGSQLTYANLSPQEVSFFISHDIIHVLFDCDISLKGEGKVKIWTIFGTTLGFWKHLKEYRRINALGLVRKAELDTPFSDLLGLMISIPRIIYESRSMAKQWPWEEYDAYLDIPVEEIRAEFNIKVV